MQGSCVRHALAAPRLWRLGTLEITAYYLISISLHATQDGLRVVTIRMY